MRASGKVNLVGLVMLAAFVTSIWFAVLFAPVYLDNLDMREAVKGAFNDAGRATDEELWYRVREAAEKVGTHVEADDQGARVVRSGLGIHREQFTIERNEGAGTVSVRLEYSREVRLAPLSKVRRVTFVHKYEGIVTK